jgi:Tol biopolymer transport system component
MRLFLRCAPLLAVAAVAACGGSAPKAPPDVLFVSTKDGDYAIFGADAKGKHVRRLTKEKGDPSTPQGLFFQTEPAWAPDATRIAFSSRRDGETHIYVMRADGTGAHRLTNTARADDHPSWSPDGKRILFAREGALFVVRPSGGAAHRVGRGFGNAAGPAWSPDGTLIAYDYRNPGTPIRELYVMRADGSGNRQLTKLQHVSGLPAWSPDGKRIAFQSNARLGHFEIYTIGADGKGLRQVSRSTTSDAFEPAWSPDGRLSFSRDGAIWVDDNGTQSQLTSGENNDSSPAWRPVSPQ